MDRLLAKRDHARLSHALTNTEDPEAGNEGPVIPEKGAEDAVPGIDMDLFYLCSVLVLGSWGYALFRWIVYALYWMHETDRTDPWGTLYKACVVSGICAIYTIGYWVTYAPILRQQEGGAMIRDGCAICGICVSLLVIGRLAL